jgi:subtilisin family serine protease
MPAEYTPPPPPERSWWRPDQPFADDYHDPRTSEQLTTDQRRVRPQVVNLGRRGVDASVRRLLLAELLQRRAAHPELVQFEAVPSERGYDMLVARGELLLRTEALQDARVAGYLASLPFHEPVPVAGLDNRVVRLRDGHDGYLGAEQLGDVARFLRGRGVQAGLNHVAPSGPIGKALAGPEPTTATLAFTPQQPGIDVAVVDTGIMAPGTRTDGWLQEPAVPRTASNVDPLYDDPVANEVFGWAEGHGSSVAGVVQQIDPAATVRMYRAMDIDGHGDEVDVAVAMFAAVHDGARILNCSFGTESIDDQPPVAMQVALELIDEEAGGEAIVVAAAGNSGSSRPCWPAAFRSVLSVASLTWDGQPSTWSNRGFWVDCATVGEGVLTPCAQGQETAAVDWDPDSFPGPDPFALWSGTSFAAPQVAGAVARLAAAGLSPRQAVAELLRLGRPLPDYGKALKLLPGT